MKIIDGARHPTVTDHEILGFFGPYRFMSNFHMLPVRVGDIWYPSTEHAYMAYKTDDREIKKYIANLEKASEARKFGQTIQLRPDWETYKSVAMLDCLYAKFQNPELRKLLLATGDRYLEETNNWGDAWWGVVQDPITQDRRGLNMLGKCLMVIRDRVRGDQ